MEEVRVAWAQAETKEMERNKENKPHRTLRYNACVGTVNSNPSVSVLEVYVHAGLIY